MLERLWLAPRQIRDVAGALFWKGGFQFYLVVFEMICNGRQTWIEMCRPFFLTTLFMIARAGGVNVTLLALF